MIDSHTADASGWDRLREGDALTMVKLAPDGEEVTRYPGAAVAVRDDGWIVVRATWTHRLVELDGLQFHPGDVLLEWFSAQHWFNAFAVYSPDGLLRGWYGNVTHPAWLETDDEQPRLVWHDLYVDLVGLPDGTVTIRDDDELRDSGLDTRDPSLHAQIVIARGELLRRYQDREAPFEPSALSVSLR